MDAGFASSSFLKLVNTFGGSAYSGSANSVFRSSIKWLRAILRQKFARPVRKQSESKLSETLLLGLIEIPTPIGAVWIPFLSRTFYNQLANRLAMRVCLDEETLVALLNNFDTNWLLRHS